MTLASILTFLKKLHDINHDNGNAIDNGIGQDRENDAGSDNDNDHGVDKS